MGRRFIDYQILFIPKDQKIIKKIEKYNTDILTQPEKEKEPEPKKEINDTEEIKNLIKKAKRNQKIIKLNVTYNEKFFDKTFFLENINTSQQGVQNFDEQGETMHYNEAASRRLSIDQKALIPMSKPDPLLQFNSSQVEKNLLNSLFYVKMKVKDLANQTPDDSIDNKFNTTEDEDVSKSKIYSENIEFEENNKAENFEKNQINDFNISIKDNLNKHASLNSANILSHKSGFKTFLLDKSTLFKDIFESRKNLSLGEQYIECENEEVSVEGLDMDHDLKRTIIIGKEDNITSTIKEIPPKEQHVFLNFKQEREKIEYEDLYDVLKRKRHRAQGYFNESMISGDFVKSLILNEGTIPKEYREISKKIFDMNDYNMNFEIFNDQTQKKEQQINQSTLNQTNGTNTGLVPNGEDFFQNIQQNMLKGSIATNNQQPVLKISKKGNLLTHAKCAYNLTYNKINLNWDDLKEFHRPNFARFLLREKKKRNFLFTISDKFDISTGDKHKRWNCTVLTRNYLRKKERKRLAKNIQYMNAYEIFKDRYKLSITDGKYCLFEHIDENPIFISNFGMASKLKKFIYTAKLFNQNIQSQTSKLTETELKTYNIIGPYGIQILLAPGSKLPLLGQIDTNDLKGISVIDNKMYRASVFYEKLGNPVTINTQSKSVNTPNNYGTNENISNGQNKKYYNFLITFRRTKEGKEGFYLRELDHHYVVGQEEPKIEVYPPQSRQYNNFLKNKIKTYTYKLYNEVGYKSGISFKVFSNLFPGVTEQILKKNFREMKIEIDKNICYFTKMPNEDTQMLITPENICQYEGCQFGIYKLREAGIKNLTNPDKISYATNKFVNSITDPKQQFLAKVIEEELLITPWNLTQNYLQSKQIKGMLAIKGIGDPSNGTGGFSFLKMPVKSYNDNKTLKEEIDQLKNQNKNIKTVTGTDADLRKLSKEDIKLKLIQLGVDEELINKYSRWERVSMLRWKSSKAAELGYEGDITKYARGMRMNSKLQKDAYQKNINEVFKKQINYITNDNVHTTYSDDESSGDEKDEIYTDSKKYDLELNEEEDEKKKGMGFMRNEIYPSKNRIKKSEKRSEVSSKKGDRKMMKIPKRIQTQYQGLEEVGNTKIKLEMKNVDVEYLKRKKKIYNRLIIILNMK